MLQSQSHAFYDNNFNDQDGSWNRRRNWFGMTVCEVRPPVDQGEQALVIK